MEKENGRQGCNYLDGPINSMAEFFATSIENLEQSIPPTQETTGKARKVPRKGNWSLLTILMMKKRSFGSTMVRADIQRINVPHSRHWSSKQNRKRANILTT